MPNSAPQTIDNSLSGHKQNRKIFDIYNVYRLVLSLILLISFYFRSQGSSLGNIDPELFVQVIIAYNIFNVLAFFRAFLPP